MSDSKSFPELDTDQHTWWLGQVMRLAFFPGAPGNEKDLMPPNAVRKWCVALEANGFISAAEVAQTVAINDRLDQEAAALVKKTAGGQQATVEDMDKVLSSLADLISHTRGLAQKRRVSEYNLDKTTGLRMEGDLRTDLDKEIKRRSRKGAPFCLALVSVDELSTFNDSGLILAGLAKIFTQSFRSFDDIYILPDKSFALSLKQTDGLDALTVLTRVKTQIAESGIPVGPGGQMTVKVRISCGVAQAEVEETVDGLIRHARSALAEAVAGGGRQVILYEEVSPLVKFARQVDKD